MEFKRSLCGIVFLVVLVNITNGRAAVRDKSNVLIEQLVQEAGKFGFKTDLSQIETVYSNEKDSDDVTVGVPLSNAVDTTSEQINKGEVYVGFQCMATKQLNGCFKVRLAGIDEKGLHLELVNEDGKVLASKTVSSQRELVKRQVAAAPSNDLIPAQTELANHRRRVWCVWINGVFQGCYDVVIIIFSNAALIFHK